MDGSRTELLNRGIVDAPRPRLLRLVLLTTVLSMLLVSVAQAAPPFGSLKQHRLPTADSHPRVHRQRVGRQPLVHRELRVPTGHDRADHAGG